MSQTLPLLQIVLSEREVKPLTLVLVLSSELLGDVLLLQVQDSLLLLFQPAEASSPERRVLVHQFLDSDLWLLGAVVRPAPVSQKRLSLFTVHIIILETKKIAECSGSRYWTCDDSTQRMNVPGQV